MSFDDWWEKQFVSDFCGVDAGHVRAAWDEAAKEAKQRIANLEHQLAEKQAEIESMQPALLRYGYLPCDECNRWFTIAMLPNHSCERE